MAAPTVTSNIAVLSSQALAAGANVTVDWDLRLKFEGRAQIKNLGGGTVAATSGLQVDVFRHTNNAVTRPDTIAMLTFVIPTTVSTEKEQSVALPTGSYRIKLTNLDATNGITVDITGETTDTVA